jgi:hypothetical protein
MAYSSRAKKRIRNAVRRSEQLERGAGRGEAVGHPQPICHHLVAKPKEDIGPEQVGDVNEVILFSDELGEEDIEVYNRSKTVTLKADKEYRFDWIQGYWLPYYEDCGGS